MFFSVVHFNRHTEPWHETSHRGSNLLRLPNAELVRHPDQFCQRVRSHFAHDLAAVNTDRDSNRALLPRELTLNLILIVQWSH